MRGEVINSCLVVLCKGEGSTASSPHSRWADLMMPMSVVVGFLLPRSTNTVQHFVPGLVFQIVRLRPCSLISPTLVHGNSDFWADGGAVIPCTRTFAER